MGNIKSAGNWLPLNARPLMSWRAMIGMLCVCASLSLNGCQASRSVQAIDCDQAERELRRYTASYLDALETIGLLRQELKASREHR